MFLVPRARSIALLTMLMTVAAFEPVAAQSRPAAPSRETAPFVIAQAEPSVRVAAGKSGQRSGETEKAPRLSEQKFKESLNRWTVGLAAGRIEGAPLRLASELAQALDDGDNLRIMPIVTRGPFDNIRDLLHLRGIDLAIVYGDTLDHFKNKEKITNVENRVMFVANLFPAEVHVLARPEINTLRDLEGKIVNFNSAGTAAAFTGPIVFERLGIKVQARFMPHRDALEKMKAGDEVAATFWVTSKPIAPLAGPAWPAGFKLLPVEYVKALEEYYLPASLENADYPKLVPQGQKIATIAVPTVLAAYNWAADTDRARRIGRMIDRLFERWPELHKAPNDPKWKDVNLAALVPGWRRYPLMQEKLDEMSARLPAPVASTVPTAAAAEAAPGRTAPINPAIIRQQAQRAAPGSRAEQERLFQQFMQWSKQRQE
jgi:TRAP-type uncharacterized transport system substrate-binding protein